ncbi:hypothetical protein EV146_102467 [Mesobacillus foraminis]|uniref:Uncharacterized protein n=1 Tax=Mesobacillus foraminis TaxID=279826 RepID=A0A4R2BLI3_9BACI|nr:hypothetical protein EV146_102467 [Mesobacillus foraminis]
MRSKPPLFRYLLGHIGGRIKKRAANRGLSAIFIGPGVKIKVNGYSKFLLFFAFLDRRKTVTLTVKTKWGIDHTKEGMF